MGKKEQERSEVSAAFKVGAISLAFMLVGYQAALFIHRAAVMKIVADVDRPDTVYVVDEALARRLLAAADTAAPPAVPGGRPEPRGTARPSGGGRVGIKVSSGHSEQARETYSAVRPRRVENFRFDPNTVSVQDLQRLGFSEKQAQSIDNYRSKGGRFRRKSDFAKSFVVADTVYARLEKYIDIPLLDINAADSAAFDALPGIGPYFAARMVSFREELGGYSCKEQLMDIYNFDESRYAALSDLICCSQAEPFPLWSADVGTLRRHPHIRSWNTARAIILYRENNPPDKLTVAGLHDAGILTDEQFDKLSRCRFK